MHVIDFINYILYNIYIYNFAVMKGEMFMNKLNKFLIIIILILIIALVLITGQYFKMKQTAQDNLKSYLDTLTQLYEFQHQNEIVK